jgi:hypothetical protein
MCFRRIDAFLSMPDPFPFFPPAPGLFTGGLPEMVSA